MSSILEPPPAPPSTEPVVPPPRRGRGTRTLVRDVIEVLLLAVALYVVIAFALQTVRVDGESMEPTLNNNDLLFADKLSYHLHAPNRGDIVVFQPTDEPNRDFIKRILAIPGDSVEIDGKHQYPDGRVAPAILLRTCDSCAAQVVHEPYLPDQSKDPWNEMVYCCDSNGRATSEPQWLRVPTDQYFMMGDNRNHSRDSRSIGLQPRNNILGRAWVRIWPLGSFGFFGAGPSLQAALSLPLPIALLRRRRRSRRGEERAAA